MSLAPKIDEVRCFVTENSPDLACITERWLNDCISDTCLHIPGYDFVYKNRSLVPTKGLEYTLGTQCSISV
jgi:hypothetical protein